MMTHQQAIILAQQALYKERQKIAFNANLGKLLSNASEACKKAWIRYQDLEDAIHLIDIGLAEGRYL
jgi:hypothetical protein